MKNLIFILLFITGYSLHGQTISMADLQEKVFDVGKSEHLTKNGTFNFECDCCSGKILFNADTTFYTIGNCGNKERLYTGTFELKDDELILSTFNAEVTKIYNEQKEFDESQPQYYYKDTIIPPSKEIFKASYRNGRWQFSNSVLDLHLLPAVDDYSDALNKVTEDKRDKRIQHAVNKNIDPFEGIIGFSSENDSLIIDRGLSKLNTASIEFGDDNTPYEINIRYSEGTVYYAPNGKFKIFSFIGDSCGAHCTGVYASYIQYRSGTWNLDAPFSGITDIKQNDSGLYIITEELWFGGLNGGFELYLSLYDLRQGVLEPVPFETSELPVRAKFLFDEHIKALTFISNWRLDVHRSLSFEPITNKVRYSYVINESNDSYLEEYIPKKAENEAILAKGEFILKGNKITDFKESYEIIRIPD